MVQASKLQSIGKLFIWSCIISLLTGCAANYARFQMDDRVVKAFENYEMIDGFHYYYSGRENKPSAIIGIDPAFQFSSTLWTAIEPSQFKKMVDRMFPPGNGRIYGAKMIAPDGKKAGVWYSWVLNYSAKFEGDRIIVHSPEPFAEPDGPEFPRSS
jgi:hypothetical protein